jgi:hypothetical protein
MLSRGEVTRKLEEFSLYKVRISVLWLLEALCYVAYLEFVMASPGVLDQIKAGTISGTPVSDAMLLFAVLLLIIMVMAILTLTLRYKLNRWLNIAAGAIYAVLEFIATVSLPSSYPAAVVLTSGFKVIFAALVALLAFWWPKQPS